MITRNVGVAVLVAGAMALAGCSTVGAVGDAAGKLNPFAKKDKPQEVAGDGRRISIIAFDQRVEASETLKGQDFFLPPALPQSDWPQPGGLGDQNVEHVEAAPAFEIAWRRGFGKGSNRTFHITTSPIVAGGRVYVMDAETDVAALDAQTGAVVWKKSTRPASRRDKDGFGGGVAYADGKLYVATGFRVVTQLDAVTGAAGWTRETASPIHGAPIVSHGRMFVVSTDNELLTYETATGAPGWTYQALVEPARILSSPSPAASGDTIVAAFASGEVVALRAANGNDLWNNTLSKASRTSALSEIRDVAGRPVIHLGDVYAASHGGIFAVTDLRTGQARWSLSIASIDSPWPAGDVVYIISQAGEVICVARESGQVYWIKDLNAGKTKSKDRALFSGPVLASDRLIVVSSDGRAIALNPKTGDVLKTIKIGAPVLTSPVVAGGMIYVVTDNGELVAIR
ncbi:MAG: PQQ-binding-like beta-propeller repeat protein [Caulobacter sp.]|nr:PQQ-binding-like beta-propeller repeat protein [Caulobacter sp.]